MTGASRVVVAAIAVSLGLACQVPMQRVPLYLEPTGARVFVDGAEAVGPPEALELRSDRPHVVHVERDGYRSQQVVLEAHPTSTGSRLEPAEIHLRLAPIVPTNQEIRIQGAEAQGVEVLDEDRDRRPAR